MSTRLPRRILLLALVLFPGALGAQNVFRLSAPPGGIYANASFEQTALVTVEVTIEHSGDAVPDWFLGATAGNGTYATRELAGSLPGSTLGYQLFPSEPDGSTPILAGPDLTGFDATNVITSNAFDTPTAAGVSRFETFLVYYEIPADQFTASGEYTDTIDLVLYSGVPGDSGTHTLEDSATVSVTGRMARLVDLLAVQESGIRTMDLTIPVSDRLLATVHERSNADTGYEVSITSANLAADASETEPFFRNSSGNGLLPYSLTYGGAAASVWTDGTALVTDTTGTAGPDWLTRDLRISYTGSPDLPAGDYEDRLIITITAK
ncbi:MAG: hypothetical protein ACOC4F_01385 [bacterium]